MNDHVDQLKLNWQAAEHFANHLRWHDKNKMAATMEATEKFMLYKEAKRAALAPYIDAMPSPN